MKKKADFWKGTTMMTGCKKLDKSRSYGEIMGATDGSKYEQDGLVFDCQGNLLNGQIATIAESMEIVEEVKPEKPRLGRPPKTI